MSLQIIPPEIRQKKTAEQAEDSSPIPSFSICDIQIQKQISRSFAKSFPQKIVRIEAPPHCPNTWRAEPQKEKCPFLFRRNWSRANPKSGEHFFAGHASGASGGGAIHSAILKIGASLVQ